MSMPSLLHLQKEGVLEKHQLEGNDPSTRSFNRTVVIARTAKRYVASTIYEDLKVQSDPHSTVAAAIADLVHQLHGFGFTNMRTRLNFRGKRYLAEKEPWVDHQPMT
ncbi:MAG TPA: hypothetical protein EYN18_03435 [Nitrospirales bacterium]|nr:hypothetical protein [Nitrospirales bacterium]HIO21434.1 hypothetical protein [Nitrospirales bacterium]